MYHYVPQTLFKQKFDFQVDTKFIYGYCGAISKRQVVMLMCEDLLPFLCTFSATITNQVYSKAQPRAQLTCAEPHC